MKPFFWVAVNLIGFIILLFMYFNIDKKRSKGKLSDTDFFEQKMFGYFQLVIMLYLIFDTGMYLSNGTDFFAARTVHCIFSVLYYLLLPLPGLMYMLYCDYKVFNTADGLKRRLKFYLIPLAVNAFIVLLTPAANIIFLIDENNIYVRSRYFWITLVIVFGYVFASYFLLAVKTRSKQALALKGENIYLYLFQIPPVIFGIIQLIFFGPLLVGIGFVISAFFIYIYSIQSSEDRRRLSVRFNNINITQFAVVFFVMIAGMLWTFEKTINEISRDYALYDSGSTANIINTYLNREIGILETAANSKTIIDWFDDENNFDKKQAAFDDLTGILRILNSSDLYIVVEASGHEYTINEGTGIDKFISHSAVSEDNFSDKWLFDLAALSNRYNMIVDVDKELYRKRAWLNFKVTNNGRITGIICSGMDVSNVAGQIFSQYDRAKTRLFVIDKDGVILIDSNLIGGNDFLIFGNTKTIDMEITYPNFISAVQTHLENIDGFFDGINEAPEVIELNSGRYKYATIAPIGATDWSVVTLFDSSSLFSPLKFLPPFVIIIILFIIFIFNSSRVVKQLIFLPLKQLVDSLLHMRENGGQKLYGMERDDEIGLLSNTIQDLFVKGHYDGLTGIYNRRYMEITLQQVMTSLSRTDSMLSVMLIDIDFFKKFNDTYGHSEGDKCLKVIARTLDKVILRSGDFVARYGGEEFAVILPGTDEAGAQLTAGKMLTAIRELKIPHEQNNNEGIVTISIGITTGYETYKRTWNDYIKKADEALYISKRSGRNKCTFLSM